MLCPFCNSSEHKVLDKRDTPDDSAIRRRRECLFCHKRFTTYEKVEMGQKFVVKKDGRREVFDPEKLIRSIRTACQKRTVSMDLIEKTANSVELEFRNLESSEIPSAKIGDMVMEKLKNLDIVAYIRFASVYRDFTDIERFHKEISDLLKEGMGR